MLNEVLTCLDHTYRKIDFDTLKKKKANEVCVYACAQHVQYIFSQRQMIAEIRMLFKIQFKKLRNSMFVPTEANQADVSVVPFKWIKKTYAIFLRFFQFYYFYLNICIFSFIVFHF